MSWQDGAICMSVAELRINDIVVGYSYAYSRESWPSSNPYRLTRLEDQTGWYGLVLNSEFETSSPVERAIIGTGVQILCWVRRQELETEELVLIPRDLQIGDRIIAYVYSDGYEPTPDHPWVLSGIAPGWNRMPCWFGTAPGLLTPQSIVNVDEINVQIKVRRTKAALEQLVPGYYSKAPKANYRAPTPTGSSPISGPGWYPLKP